MDEREIERDLAQLTLDQHAFNEQLMAKVADQGARLLIAQSTIDALRQALTHEQQRRGALEAVRPVIRAFAQMMERELQANAHKGTWEGYTPAEMFNELRYHVEKLDTALIHGDKAGIAEYSADVANMAMMVADTAQALTPQPTTPQAAEGEEA